MSDLEETQPVADKVDLERLSIDELKARIEHLRGEISACEVELEKKANQLSTANALFGSSD